MKPKGVKKKIPDKKRATNDHDTIRRKRYTKESLNDALEAIKKGMSKKLASKTFNVPRATLQFRRKFPDAGLRPGPSTVLTANEEWLLEDWLMQCARKGFPKRKEDLLLSVQEFIKKSDRPNPFTDGIPGEKWFKLFLRRHPNIVLRMPEAVTSSSAVVSEADIKAWFSTLREYLEENQLLDITSDPQRIFNGDETGFILCPKTGAVLAQKGEKNVYEVDHAPAKTSLTVLFTFGADGTVTPPLVIFPNKRLPANIASKVPSEWGIGLSDNGWMKADIFKDYIENVLHPFLKNKKTKFPIILYVDGHKTHLTYEISMLCTKLEIVLVALYPNSTRILQPADVAAFKPLKEGWKKTVRAWRRENPSKILTKVEFVPLLEKTIDNAIRPSIIVNGFRATGLYPFDEEAIDYSKCLGKKNTTEKTVDSNSASMKTNEIKMTESDFIQIIGEEKWKSISEGNLPDVDEDMQKIWKFFKERSKCKKDDLANDKLQQHEVADNDDSSVYDIENMNILFADDSQTETSQVIHIGLSNEVTIEEVDDDFSDTNKYTKNEDQEPLNNHNSNQNHIFHTAQVHFDDHTTANHGSETNIPRETYLKALKQIDYDKIEEYDPEKTSIAVKQTESRTVESEILRPLDAVILPEFVTNEKDTKEITLGTKGLQTQPVETSMEKVHVESIDYNKKIEFDTSNFIQTQTIDTKTKKLIDIGKLTPVKLSDILILPKTPERKGVKNTKKVPFVLTSEKWKEHELVKKKEKEEKIEGVKRRKEERERKKEEKMKIKKEKRDIKKSKENMPKVKNVSKKKIRNLSPKQEDITINLNQSHLQHTQNNSQNLGNLYQSKNDSDETYYDSDDEVTNTYEPRRREVFCNDLELEQYLSKMEDTEEE